MKAFCILGLVLYYSICTFLLTPAPCVRAQFPRIGVKTQVRARARCKAGRWFTSLRCPLCARWRGSGSGPIIQLVVVNATVGVSGGGLATSLILRVRELRRPQLQPRNRPRATSAMRDGAT
jgi:hypothetical protein